MYVEYKCKENDVRNNKRFVLFVIYIKAEHQIG